MDEVLLGRINNLAQDVFDSIHKSKPFIPGETRIPVTGKFFGVQEIASAMMAAGEFWLTSGPHTDEFAIKLANRI